MACLPFKHSTIFQVLSCNLPIYTLHYAQPTIHANVARERYQGSMQITVAHKKAVDQYYRELAVYKQQDVTHETAVRSAFQNLLAAFAPNANWTLIPEEPLANGKRPDGTLRDTF